MLSHKEKVKLARRNRTPEEHKFKISIWGTRFWIMHAKKIQDRVEEELKIARLKKEMR